MNNTTVKMITKYFTCLIIIVLLKWVYFFKAWKKISKAIILKCLIWLYYELFKKCT